MSEPIDSIHSHHNKKIDGISGGSSKWQFPKIVIFAKITKQHTKINIQLKMTLKLKTKKTE